MPTEPVDHPVWYRSIMALLDRLRCCVKSLNCQLDALPPDDSDHRKTTCQAFTEACNVLSQAQELCALATEHLRQGTTPDKRWFEGLHHATMWSDHLLPETRERIQLVAPEPPVKVSESERKRSAAFLWRACAEILATKVFRRLSSGILDPARDGPLIGVFERCETSAEKVGDMEHRMDVSPTLETARLTVVQIARQVIEEGCSEAEARQMMGVAGRERERIRGAVVDAELEFAAVEPIIVAG